MKIGKTMLEVLCAHITEVPVEAVVNPANDMLWMGGGVSALIRKVGGDTIESEALKKAPAVVGDAVVTGAGSMKVRWIIHAVISGQDLVATESSIRKAMRASLIQANAVGCSSLAIPMLTTEISHIEIHIVARSIVEETVHYLTQENKSLNYTVFVDHDESVRDIIDRALLEIFTKHG